MGIYDRSSRVLVLFSTVSLLSLGAEATNRVWDRLERGEVVASKTGSSFVVQSLAKGDPTKVAAQLENLNDLPKLFPNIAFVRTYKTTGKTAKENKRYIYMKLRGLGDGVGVLFEVKEGALDSFQNAFELMAGASAWRSRETTKEVNLKTPQDKVSILTDATAELTQEEGARTVTPQGNIVLEGPLNEIMQMPNTRITANLLWGKYEIEATPAQIKLNPALAYTPVIHSYVAAKISFGNQVSREHLGDYRGFGDRRLSLAQVIGADVMSNLRLVLEKI